MTEIHYYFSVYRMIIVGRELLYRKLAIDRPGGKQFLATHNF
jgi:hypothetical protein